MGQGIRKLIAATVVAGFSVLLVAGAAGAADYPPTDPPAGHLTLPATVAANGMIDFAGSGCGANQSVNVAFNGAKVMTAKSAATGDVAGAFAVPSGTAAGTYTVALANSFCSLSGTVQVMGASLLPHTGSSNTIQIVLGALAAIAVGSMLVTAARRRRQLARPVS